MPLYVRVMNFVNDYVFAFRNLHNYGFEWARSEKLFSIVNVSLFRTAWIFISYYIQYM